uniref:Uncharacterized protein LOC104221283 n=1 Tax=Nicotiana sylvestris TaxID=4096 RepID=A0A1U7VW58_NICSY|nr:PREDICTED: uncharacterized protein LOC104221283 [Nicotiana sylvestris]
MEVYIGDMLVKSLRAEDHLKHLQETFDILRKYNMKLNPEKCAFGIGSGKFLGFMVSNRRIEINPDKIKPIKDIKVVDSVKVVQRLTGRIAALGKNNFAWTSECHQDLEELKRYLSSTPLLHTPKADEQLYLYLAVLKITNNEVDALANLGLLVEDDKLNPGTVVQLSRTVIEEGHVEINSTSLTYDWRNKYIEYLKNGNLLSDPKESRALRTKVARFTLAEDGTLFRRTFDGPLAIFLGPGDTDYVLREIYEGTYGNYSGAESLVHKVIRAGYYWADMEKDTKEFVRKCDKC